MNTHVLDFEKPLVELDNRIKEVCPLVLLAGVHLRLIKQLQHHITSCTVKGIRSTADLEAIAESLSRSSQLCQHHAAHFANSHRSLAR